MVKVVPIMVIEIPCMMMPLIMYVCKYVFLPPPLGHEEFLLTLICEEMFLGNII
jgi:hypothetical protein